MEMSRFLPAKSHITLRLSHPLLALFFIDANFLFPHIYMLLIQCFHLVADLPIRIRLQTIVLVFAFRGEMIVFSYQYDRVAELTLVVVVITIFGFVLILSDINFSIFARSAVELVFHHFLFPLLFFNLINLFVVDIQIGICRLFTQVLETTPEVTTDLGRLYDRIDSCFEFGFFALEGIIKTVYYSSRTI